MSVSFPYSQGYGWAWEVWDGEHLYMRSEQVFMTRSEAWSDLEKSCHLIHPLLAVS